MTNVLIVEDEQAIRRFLRTALEADGLRVYDAETLQRGLLEAATRKPDLIILDLALPDGDGIDFIRDLRQWSAVPVIVLSARSEESDKIAALDAGADDFNAEDNVFEITTDPDAFNDVVKALEEKNYAFVSADISLVPQTYVKLESDEDIKNMEKLLDMLDDNEDVQNTYHNWDQD